MVMFFMIDYLKKRPAILVFLVTFLLYSPLLLNHFVGDDHTIIETNTFYKSWKNIPRLFEKGYISNAKKIIFYSEPQSDFGTGSVSYRPISNLTYFLDFYLFQAKPYGSHLINILIHCVNSVLVFWIVYQIFSSSALGVFAGLLFSLHPIQSEAVAVMSYRADIVAAMFVLFSFYFWIKFKQNGYVGKRYYAGSLVMFLLALFSKESAFMLPVVVVLFDQILARPNAGLRQRGIFYIGFILVLMLHVYLYFVVFPNASLFFHWLGGSFVNHCLIMGYIWYTYLMNILLPWTVKLTPGLYCPPAPALASLVTIEIALALTLLITGILVLWRNYKECAFFVLWYIIFYLPVSNLLPIANPMACRFMYLPSIGILIVLAFFLHKAFKSDLLKKYSRNLSGIFHVAVIMVCLIRTLFLNGVWKNDFNVGWEWVRSYPTFGRGYALLGKEYYNAGHFEKAKEYFEKSVLLGDTMPREVLSLAECYMQLGKFQEAKSLLKQIIIKNPDYADPFLRLGSIYYLEKNDSQAQKMLEKALMIDPQEPSGYVFLMKVYLDLHESDAAKTLLNKADSHLNAQNISELRDILERSKQHI
jgi:protein O-mannosyl-transferase